MATSEAQSSAIEAAPTQETAHVYAMSREGRRQAIVLLLGVVSIWVFALWSLITILEGGITGIEWVSSVLMLGILLVAPLVGWGLLEEAYSRLSLSDGGIRYQTIGGLDVTYRWEDLAGFEKGRRRGRIARLFLGDGSDEEAESARTETTTRAAEMDSNDEESGEDDPDTLLLQVREGHTVTIDNPVLRFLHSQAHGDALPIYGGLENRDALLIEINTRLGKS